MSGEYARILGARYRLLRCVADGAMGAVWQARDEVLGHIVAIKLLHPRTNATDVEWAYLKRRLAREGRITATIRHPAIVTVLDVGVMSNDEPYLVLEFLRGKALDQLLVSHGPLSPARAVRVLLPIAEGLAAIHTLGVVHRDVKPENIFLGWEAPRKLRPKLIDFGVAKLLDPFRREQLTGPGVIGTPGYMAPEQILDSSDVDGRADVWSFCAVLYETCSGRVPFGGRTCTEVLRAVLEHEPSPLTHTIGLDVELWRIIERGLRRERDKRWETMRALSVAMRAWLTAQGIEPFVEGAM